MPQPAADLSALSRLLDEALDLEPAQVDAWLAGLPAEHAHLLPRLRAMLAEHVSHSHAGFMSGGPKLADSAADPSLPQAGDLVGPYRLIRAIGHGGMGSVWLAERADGAYRRQVALKLPRLAWGAGLAERMAREREIGMLLEHPAIARLYDAGVDERGRPFLALEYVDGLPIDAWCDAQGLRVRDRLRLFVQVVRAVAYAHGRLVVHRDLKPSNVLVTPDGQAHLLDFGIAKLLDEAADEKLTQQQGRVMTPHYASPEQVAAEPITVQSDVYSLGVLLYELLTGTLPIAPKRSTLGAVEEAILEGDAPLASSRVKDRATAKALRGEVDAILAKAMQREPGRRYATADALAQDIERHLNGETVTARPDSVGYRLRKAVRRHWVGVSAAAAVLLAVIAGSGVAVVQAQRAARSAERERVVKDFVADVFRVNSRVDARNAAMRPASTEALLDSGAQLIESRFADQPDLQAELYGIVGGIFADMGAHRLALNYATRRVEVLIALHAGAAEQSRALLMLALAMFEERRYPDAETQARRALQLAENDRDLRLTSLVLLARIQDADLHHESMAATLSELEVELRRQGEIGSSAAAWLPFLRARVLTALNQLDEALPLYRSAIDTALQTDGPLSLTAVEMRLSLVRRLAQTKQFESVGPDFDAAIHALRQWGGVHEVRAAYAEADYARRRHSYGFSRLTVRDTLAILDRSRETLSASALPVPPWFIPQIDFWRGDVMVSAGDIAGGWPLMEKAAQVLVPAAGSSSDRWATISAMGVAAMHAGHHEQADDMLREMMAVRRLRGRGRHPYAALDYTLVAENLLMAGRTTEAQALLDQAPTFEPIRGEGLNPDRYNRFISQARARVRMAAGDSADALSRLNARPPAPEESEVDRANYRALLGEVLCNSGRQTDGLPLLTESIKSAESGDVDPRAPWVARLRALAGLCVLGIADRTHARRYAVQARAAFTAQPGVSPYYKAPLFKLERALGLRLPPV